MDQSIVIQLKRGEVIAAAGQASIVTYYCMVSKERFLQKGNQAYHILELFASARLMIRPISSLGELFNTASRKVRSMGSSARFKKSAYVWNQHRTVSLIIRLAIGFVFIFAGILKLMDPAAFAWNIYQYGLVPRDLVNVTAIGLPAIEVIAGVGFLFSVRGSMVLIACLLVMFTIALAYALLNGLNVDCGCFSVGEPGPEGIRKALIRDVIMMVGIFYIYWFREKKR